MFSFGYREAGYWSHISDSTRFYAAPFWGDLNIEDGGDIFYEIHSAPSLLIDQVSSLISLREGVPFSGTWMVVAYWKNTQQFGFPNGSVSGQYGKGGEGGTAPQINVYRSLCWHIDHRHNTMHFVYTL